MKKIPILTILLAGIVTFSCSKKTPEIANTIPDDAFLVASFNPQQLFEKGQISSMDAFIGKIDQELIRSILKEPAKSGIDLGEYAFVYSYFIDEEPIFGLTAVLEDQDKFAANMKELLNEKVNNLITEEEYTMLVPDHGDGCLAWNDEQVIFLSSPDKDLNGDRMKEQLLKLFGLTKEDAITSVVDFNDFAGKMEDMNVWFTGDQFKEVLEKSGVMKEMKIDLPLELYNNYGQIFISYDKGAMNIHGETHLSDDVAKVTETFLVAKDNLNKDMLKLAPGNDLILAMAYGLDLDRATRLMKNFMPPEMDSMGGKLEETLGIGGEELLEALSGDFVVAVNGAAEGSMIPVEVMIGIGIKDETIQEKFMENMGDKLPIENQGDFFLINIQGNEIYSGIINNIWVITNAKGYKDAVTGKGLEKSLLDSKFNDYANGSMGMYMNLDVTSYPSTLQGMIGSGGAPEMLELITESLSFIGIESTNLESNALLKTANDDENSLYTLLQMMEKAAEHH